jgi:hypothetical protein
LLERFDQFGVTHDGLLKGLIEGVYNSPRKARCWREEKRELYASSDFR